MAFHSGFFLSDLADAERRAESAPRSDIKAHWRREADAIKRNYIQAVASQPILDEGDFER